MTIRALHGTRRLAAFAASVATLLVALMIATTTVQAEGTSWYARMPAKTWSTNGDFHSSLHYMFIEKREGPGAMCIGPAQISGGKWVFPYGWNCQSYNGFGWEFGPIGAYPAVDNPNSQPFTFALLYF